MLCFILILAHVCRVSIRKITTPQIFIGFGLVMSFLGYPVLFFQLDDYRKAVGLTDPELIIQATIASGWSIIGVIFVYGLLVSLSNRSVSREKSRLDNTGIIKSEIYKPKEVYSAFWFMVLTICVFVLAIYLSNIPNIALLESFTGGNVALARSLMTNDFKGSYHWYRLFFYDLSWLSSLVLFAGALRSKTLRSWILFGASFVFVSFCLLMTAQKSPMIFYLGTLFLIYSFLENNGVVSFRSLALLFAAAAVILVPMYFIFMGSSDPFSALSSIVSRSLTGQLSGAYHYQWIFPDHIDYLYGRSFPNPRGLLPFEHFPLPTEVMRIVHPHLIERGIVGSEPTIYWGEIYANFGWIGVFVSPIYVGSFIFLCHWVVSKIKDFAMKGAVTVWVGIQLGRFAYSGVSWSFLPETLGAGFMIIFFYLIIGTIRKQLYVSIRNPKAQSIS